MTSVKGACVPTAIKIRAQGVRNITWKVHAVFVQTAAIKADFGITQGIRQRRMMPNVRSV